MPLIRKLLEVGHSRSITLPKTWLDNAEEEEGRKIVAVAMEVNGCLTINPIFEKEQKKAGVPCQSQLQPYPAIHTLRSRLLLNSSSLTLLKCLQTKPKDGKEVR